MHAKFETEGLWNPVVQERHFVTNERGELWEYYVIAENKDNRSFFGFVPQEGAHGCWMLYSSYDLAHVAKRYGQECAVHDLDFEPVKFSLLIDKLNNVA